MPFVTAGDPSLEAIVPVMHALVDAGADLIELGVPFSDPMADGPMIQRSSERALARRRRPGVRARLRARVPRADDATTPVVLMGYLNPVEIRGAERFAREAVAAGVDGVLLVDCPLEEIGGVRGRVRAPRPGADPARRADHRATRAWRGCAHAAQGYLYYVCFAGITGADRLEHGRRRGRVRAIRARSEAPVAVGFGIRDAASAAAIGAFADARRDRQRAGRSARPERPMSPMLRREQRFPRADPRRARRARGGTMALDCTPALRRLPYDRRDRSLARAPAPNLLSRSVDMNWLQKLMPARIRTEARAGRKRRCPRACGRSATAAARCCTGPKLEEQPRGLPEVRPPHADPRARAPRTHSSTRAARARSAQHSGRPIVLKFRDSKKYPDRINAAQKATGEKDALIAMQRHAARASRWSPARSTSPSWAARWARSSARGSRARPSARWRSAARWCASPRPAARACRKACSR